MTTPAVVVLAICWGTALSLSGWLAWQLHKRPRRHWEGIWHDGNEPGHHRVCSGAKSVTGRVVYTMWDDDGRAAYIGKATNFPSRAKQHAQHIKSQVWRRWTAEPVPWWQPSFVLEARRIAELHPYQNRNKGTRRPGLRARLLFWRY